MNGKISQSAGVLDFIRCRWLKRCPQKKELTSSISWRSRDGLVASMKKLLEAQSLGEIKGGYVTPVFKHSRLPINNYNCNRSTANHPYAAKLLEYHVSVQLCLLMHHDGIGDAFLSAQTRLPILPSVPCHTSHETSAAYQCNDSLREHCFQHTWFD